jgi:GT2 family glycosyltransferase
MIQRQTTNTRSEEEMSSENDALVTLEQDTYTLNDPAAQTTPLAVAQENISNKLGTYTVARESYLYDLSIVIVSYNTKDLTRECLQSVYREAEGISVEVMLVDNNSSDGSQRMVETEFPQVKLVRSPVNLGFGAANNVALATAEGRYIVLLNTDAFLSPGSLSIALDHMNKNPRAALGGARLVGRDHSWQPSARMFPHVFSDLLVLTGLAARFPKSRLFGYFDRTWADPLQPSQADWVPGAFSIIRSDVLRSVGFFDPRFFMYGEEVDLCRRIKMAGHQIWYWPDIVVVHIGGESSRNMKDGGLPGAQVVNWRMRSTLLYYRKHHGSMARLAKWLESLLYRVSSLRNRLSRNPVRRLRGERYKGLAAAMELAWIQTQGGRVSPPHPW